jgi:hypothetical protein
MIIVRALERMITFRKRTTKNKLKERKNPEIRKQIYDTIRMIKEERNIIDNKMIK